MTKLTFREVKKKEDNKSFDLFKVVKNLSTEIQPSQITPKYINEKAVELKNNFVESEFVQFSAILFCTHGIMIRILETYLGGNVKYLQTEDYFQTFMEVLWKCIIDYNPKIGNFDNYFIKTFHYTFLECKRQSFFKITTHVPKNKRKEYRDKSISSYDNSIGQVMDIDSKIMLENIHKILETDLSNEEKSVIQAMFFTNPTKKLTEEQAAKICGISENQLHYQKANAYKRIRNKHPELLNDFCSYKDNTIFDNGASVSKDVIDDPYRRCEVA